MIKSADFVGYCDRKFWNFCIIHVNMSVT